MRITLARAQLGARRAPFHSCWPTFDAGRLPQYNATGPIPIGYLHRFDFGFFVVDIRVRA